MKDHFFGAFFAFGGGRFKLVLTYFIFILFSID